MFDPRFESQAALVVRCLPEVAKHDCFALKGGTAINMFVRNLPRISVDIDLTYLPLRQRDESLEEISSALLQLKADIEGNVPHSRVSERRVQGYVAKLSVATSNTEIKVEPNLVLRGCLGTPILLCACGLIAEMMVEIVAGRQGRVLLAGADSPLQDPLQDTRTKRVTALPAVSGRGFAAPRYSH